MASEENDTQTATGMKPELGSLNCACALFDDEDRLVWHDDTFLGLVGRLPELIDLGVTAENILAQGVEWNQTAEPLEALARAKPGVKPLGWQCLMHRDRRIGLFRHHIIEGYSLCLIVEIMSGGEGELDEPNRFLVTGTSSEVIGHLVKSITLIVRDLEQFPSAESSNQDGRASRSLRAKILKNRSVRENSGSSFRDRKARIEPIYAGDVISKLAALIRPMLRDDLRLSLSQEEDVLPVNADPIDFESAILSMVLSTISTMQKGGLIKVFVQNTRNLASGAVFVTTVVSSNDTATHYAEPRDTQEMGPSGKAEFPTFLSNLSFARRFAERTGGELKTTSKSGKSTFIVLSLPAGDVSGAEG